MLVGGTPIDFLMGGEAGGQSLGRRGERGWQLGRIAWKRVVELTRQGRSRTRRGRAFHGRGR